MVIAFLTFLAMYLIAGATIRLFVMKFPNAAASKALMFAH